MKTWARGAIGRALIALILVGALVTCGWLLIRDPAQPEQATAAAAAAAGGTGGGAVPSGPSVLEASAPVQAQAPRQTGGELDAWAAGLSPALDIPAPALVGYATGELTLRKERPGCHLSWVTLAGIGKAGTDHGRSRGGADVLGTGKPGLRTIGDAAVAAGRSLCASGADLGTGKGWWKAIAGFKDADLFRQQVLGNAQLYSTLSVTPALAEGRAARAVRFALDQLGLPYVWGGNGPDSGSAGFDCSGLTKAAYESAGLQLPRTADSQFRSTPPVPLNEEPKLGDLVFYGSPATRIHHVGLYLGNGMMINAPTEGQAIQIHTYHTRGDDYTGAGRPEAR
ncbi:C40 family peptidase [Amycolatopsis anabasis]|uniref:C40 family peptidase n=1 Tax=Amycolatopsis anabasis TaxID=1840409 RepID=UPI00131E6266|nr:C40 family peptidase [Amycolatopsis anabasis]